MAGNSPVQDAKAAKNQVEQEGMRQCHIRDGTALVEYFAWLENELLLGKQLDEVEAADKLEEFRRYLPLFLRVVFDKAKWVFLLGCHLIPSVRRAPMVRLFTINLRRKHVLSLIRRQFISATQEANTSNPATHNTPYCN